MQRATHFGLTDLQKRLTLSVRCSVLQYEGSVGHKRPNFSQLIRDRKFLAFAHRGANQLAPENTHAAFQIAHELGYRIIETDVQSSSDGVLYCFHDDHLQCTTGDPRKFENVHSQDIDQLRINGMHAIPKLAELFEAFPEAYFNIDIKSWSATGPFIALATSMNACDRLCVGSFNQRRIKAVTSSLSQSPPARSLGTGGVARFYLKHLLNWPGNIRANCAQLPVSYFGIKLITPQTLVYAKSKGLKIHVWTINQADEIQRLIDLGVDGIMTDDCVLLKSILEKNGLWDAF